MIRYSEKSIADTAGKPLLPSPGAKRRYPLPREPGEHERMVVRVFLNPPAQIYYWSNPPDAIRPSRRCCWIGFIPARIAGSYEPEPEQVTNIPLSGLKSRE